MTNSTDKLKKAAAAVQRAATTHGFTVVVIDDQGRAHTIPGATIEMVGVYAEGARRDYIADDLKAAGWRD